MTAGLILTVIAILLFTVAAAIAACAIVLAVAKSRASFTVQAALRYFEEHDHDPQWEADT